MVAFQHMDRAEACTILVGSLRTASVNRAAANYAAQLLGKRFAVHQPDLGKIPLFNQDLEGSDDPAPVAALKAAVAQSSVVLCFTPEYNYSTSGVLKNSIDWLSRPFRSGSLTGRVVAIASVTPSSKGGENAREHLLKVCGVLTERLYKVTLGIPNVTELENDSRPELAREMLPNWLDEVVAFHSRLQNRQAAP